jgi:hypothetical protein
MSLSSNIEEKQLHKIWIDQDFLTDIFTASKESISVINTGDYNQDSGGPDFKNARVQIGSLTFVGDIEIDRDYSDWKKHGHNINKHYNKVILHLCYSNKQKQNYVYTSEGRKIPSVELKEYIFVDNIKKEITLAGKKDQRNSYSLKCGSEIHLVESEIRRKFLLKLGLNRFQQKCNRMFNRLKELKFLSELEINEPVIRYELSKQFNEKDFSHNDFRNKDLWDQLLYEFIFEALGYSKNKNIMMKLAQSVPLEMIKKFDLKDEITSQLESILFHVSGLMPDFDDNDDQVSNYLKELKQYWHKYSKIYDGKRFDETQWQFLGQRPQNFPTVRISGGAKIVDAIINKNFTGTLIKKITEITSNRILINSIRSLIIVRASGYWKEHFVFEKKSDINLNYIVGLSRADEIFINVFLPFLSVYFDIFGNENLSRKVISIFNEYEQKLDNKITREVSNGLNLINLNKKTIYAQGMIELYRNYCTKNKCLECEIGTKIFN